MAVRGVVPWMTDVPTIRMLVLDTNALVKLFVPERGHDVVRWLETPEAIIGYSVHLVTSMRVREEFPSAIRRKVERGELSCDVARGILTRFHARMGSYGVGFPILDRHAIPDFRDGRDTSADKLKSKYGLKDCDLNDCAILASVVNFLRCCGGGSLPQVITSDRRFKRAIRGEGYGVVDPEKLTVEELKSHLASLV